MANERLLHELIQDFSRLDSDTMDKSDRQKLENLLKELEIWGFEDADAIILQDIQMTVSDDCSSVVQMLNPSLLDETETLQLLRTVYNAGASSDCKQILDRFQEFASQYSFYVLERSEYADRFVCPFLTWFVLLEVHTHRETAEDVFAALFHEGYFKAIADKSYDETIESVKSRKALFYKELSYRQKKLKNFVIDVPDTSEEENLQNQITKAKDVFFGSVAGAALLLFVLIVYIILGIKWTFESLFSFCALFGFCFGLAITFKTKQNRLIPEYESLKQKNAKIKYEAKEINDHIGSVLETLNATIERVRSIRPEDIPKKKTTPDAINLLANVMKEYCRYEADFNALLLEHGAQQEQFCANCVLNKAQQVILDIGEEVKTDLAAKAEAERAEEERRQQEEQNKQALSQFAMLLAGYLHESIRSDENERLENEERIRREESARRRRDEDRMWREEERRRQEDKRRDQEMQRMKADLHQLRHEEAERRRKESLSRPSFKMVFYVNNRRSEQIVTANSSYDARKLIEAQYPGAKVVFSSSQRL